MFYIELANFYIETLTKHLQKFGKVRLPDSYFEILFFKLKVAQKIYRELLEISRMIKLLPWKSQRTDLRRSCVFVLHGNSYDEFGAEE